MKHILVPTDFSSTANSALDYAVCLARKSGARILLLHACALLHHQFHDRKHVTEEYNDSVQKSANAQLDILKNSIEETEGILVSKVLSDGGVIDSIMRVAVSNKVDLIVMGTVGRTGLRNKLLGSRTSELISESEIPVLTIPYAYDWSEPKRILLALNDPDETLACLKPAFEIAELFGADVKAAIFTGNREEALEVMEHSRNIHSIREKLHVMYDKAVVHTVHLGGHDFEDAIQEYITANDIDLLAMITHKRQKTQYLFDRSMTRKMNYHTTVPLLSIHAPT